MRPVYHHRMAASDLPAPMVGVAGYLARRGLQWEVWYQNGWFARVAGVPGTVGVDPDQALRIAEENYHRQHEGHDLAGCPVS